MKSTLIKTLFCIQVISACSDAKTIDVNKLGIKCPQIYDIISEIYTINQNQYNWDKNTFFISVQMEADDYELRIAILSKQDVSWLLRDHRKELYGYFEVGKCFVLTHGELASMFFSKSNEAKEFDWLKISSKNKALSKEIDVPPIIFEPEVWIYRFVNGKFLFEKKGGYSVFID
jgi:hypothetical protein